VRKFVFLSLIALALVACGPKIEAAPPDPRAQSGLEVVPLTVHSANGNHRFTVEVARTAEQQSRGMMYRRSVAKDRGMIFPFDPPQNAAFWMENTWIPLDMVFIRADGTIARIATAKPLDETPVPAGEPVAAVLEIRGGRSAQLGIRPGDRVKWRR
jgi:uncharacterized membrane protein (UPF0127 family)